MGRNAQTTLAGQAQLAMTLGTNDPRHRRRSQGLAGNQDFYVGYGLRKDDKGRLEVDVQQIAQAICFICKNPPPPPPDPCDPLTDPCFLSQGSCCPAGTRCNPTGGPNGDPTCFDPNGGDPCSNTMINYCWNFWRSSCSGGECVFEGDSPSGGGCGCGGSCGGGDAVAWLGF